MGKFWESLEFKKQLAEWEEKLKESGFEDAEKNVGNDRFLKKPSIYAYRDSKRNILKESELEYRQILMEAIQDEKGFEDDLDRLIMERTAEGKKICEISEELKKCIPEGKKRSKHYRNTIRFVRRRYENKWGIRCWKPEEMVSRKPKKPATK